MPVSDAHKRATQKWEANNYDKILLRIRKDAEPTRETIAANAEKAGESLNGYIIKAISNRIEQRI